VVSVAVIVIACPDDSRPRPVAGAAARGGPDAGAVAQAGPSACGWPAGGGWSNHIGAAEPVPGAATAAGSAGFPGVHGSGQPTGPGYPGGSWSAWSGPGWPGPAGWAAKTSRTGPGLIGAPQPAQYHADPPTGFPQFKQNRMRAPWLLAPHRVR
jgi:hypothetical protein